jgi:hypothetical protein
MMRRLFTGHLLVTPDRCIDAGRTTRLLLYPETARKANVHVEPRVIVTDLRRDYAPLIVQVFPTAQHHECIFHSEQEVSRYRLFRNFRERDGLPRRV